VGRGSCLVLSYRGKDSTSTSTVRSTQNGRMQAKGCKVGEGRWKAGMKGRLAKATRHPVQVIRLLCTPESPCIQCSNAPCPWEGTKTPTP
jgi:hypothetical protein